MIQIKNFLIKREQSQACLSFAKREKSRLLAKTLLTLVALLAVTTGAWAADSDALAGVFTINTSGDKVQFSKGNLQAVFSAAGTDCTWQFAENQWDCSGYGGGTGGNYLINGNGSVSAPGTVDLFGWSTSTTKFGILRSTNNNDFSGDFVDWGVNIGEGWRTLSADEWKYLLDNHTYGFATVCDVKGIIVLPDGCSLTINTDHNNFNNNTIDAAEWASTYAPVGVLFLPAHGYLYGNEYSQHQITAYYWSSTAAATDGQKYGIQYTYRESPNSVYNESKKAFNASCCFSVRLVRKAVIPTPVNIAWDATTKTGTFSMPGGNVELEPEYYDLATLADKGLTAAEDAAATTEAELVVVADGAVTGGTLMYYVTLDANFTQADAIALAEDKWDAAIPTAEELNPAGGTYYVWYYIKGDDEHSDTDPQRLAVTVLPQPTYTVEVAEVTDPNKWTASPNTDVKKGTEVTVTYTGQRKVMGVKAAKKGGKPVATLADALVDGATVVIAFSYGNSATNTFTNNNGTFTLTDATGFGAASDETTQLTADGSNLIFKANLYTSIDQYWDSCGFQVTIDTTDNTYVVWKSVTAQAYSAKFTSITVNGTEIQLSEQK